MSEEECIRRSIGLLRDSVRLQLRSDVPLGVFLSGGVDSSAVVAPDARDGHPRHPHLHRRLRLRPGVRRDPLRAAGGREVRHRSTARSSSPPRSSGTSSRRWSGTWTSRSPSRRRSRCSSSPSWRARTSSWCSRARVGRGLRRLSDLQVHADAGALPPAPRRRAPGHDQSHAQPARRQVEQVHRALRSAARAALHRRLLLRDEPPRTRSTGRRSKTFSTAAPCPAW